MDGSTVVCVGTGACVGIFSNVKKLLQSCKEENENENENECTDDHFYFCLHSKKSFCLSNTEQR